MESRKNYLINCFLSSKKNTKCDRSCRRMENGNDSTPSILFSQVIEQYQLYAPKHPIPLESLEVPLQQDCYIFSELILIGECAVKQKSIETLVFPEEKSALLLCFCPESVTEPKIVKKLADLIEQLCIKRIRLIIAHESCCQIGNTLIEKTKAILDNVSIHFSTEFINSA